MTDYELTQDENIVKKVIVKEEFIDIKKLETESADLQKKLLDIPFKTIADQETLDFFNQEQIINAGKDYLETELQNKEALLIELQNLRKEEAIK